MVPPAGFAPAPRVDRDTGLSRARLHSTKGALFKNYDVKEPETPKALRGGTGEGLLCVDVVVSYTRAPPRSRKLLEKERHE